MGSRLGAAEGRHPGRLQPGGPQLRDEQLSTAPGIGRVLGPSPVRTAQIYVPPGRSATKGPIGVNPSRENGVPLNILAGLTDDEPIYDGDFADPTALAAGSTLYFYASSQKPPK